MVGADDIVLSIIIISSVQNFLFDLFAEVGLEYAVRYTRQYIPDFSIPGFGPEQTSAVMDGDALPRLIDQLSLSPQLIDKLSPEHLELLNTMLVSMQVAG